MSRAPLVPCTRRTALARLAGLGVVATLPGAYALAAPPKAPAATAPAIPKWPTPDQPRQIWLRRRETGEACIARYYDGATLNFAEYSKACVLLRDLRSGTVAHIDVELLDLVYAMQQWLVSWGVDQPLLVHSGYRNAHTNSREGGVRNSLHTHGRAIDFSMRGLSTEYLGRLTSVLRAGGVGFYANSHFVHGDTGAVRYWRTS